jgi:glycerol-3-phosphate acyltransferase PlsY
MLATWLIIALIFRYSSLAALITTFLAPFYMFFFNSDLYFLFATAIISLLLMWKHKQNAINLVNGTEQKIGSSKKEENTNA